MPYLLISTQIRLEVGPTFIADGYADPSLLERLGATPSKTLGNEFQEFATEKSPRIILDMLEKEGFKVVGMTGIGQTCAWTLYKEPS